MISQSGPCGRLGRPVLWTSLLLGALLQRSELRTPVVGVALTGFLIDLTGTYNSVFVMVACVNVAGALIWALFASGERLVD